jgi:hypothetical protein
MTRHLLDVRAELDAVRERVARLAERRGPRVADFCARARDVVVVASSSRGGSSVFSETLRASPDLLHLQAELNPLLTLAGLHPLDTGGLDDAIAPGTPFDHATLDRELALDAGRRSLGPVDLRRWSTDLTWRLTVQWPGVPWSADRVGQWLEAAWREVLGNRSPDDGLPEGALQAIHLAIIRHARTEAPEVHPRMWDLDAPRVDAAFPELSAPLPPREAVVEEPPFVPVGPWERATAAELDKPFIIKTPSNAYRLAFLRSLFPNARFRVLHLTRNPAAAINGLVDGWRYHGFHAHPVEPPLQTAGYADVRPQDARFFKYDLFPGWREVVDRPLVCVAAHQWAAAHRATLQFLDTHSDFLRVRFEDIVGAPEVRRATFRRVTDWLGVDTHPALQQVIETPLPPVMATARPRARRWFARADALVPALSLPVVQEVAGPLGYTDPDTWV